MADNHEKKNQIKRRRRVFGWIAAACVVAVLAALPMLAAQKQEEPGSGASIISAAVTARDMEVRLVGGGKLASENSVRLKIPEEVKLKEYLVGNGDTVAKGDPIAVVDRVSVMTAITGVQDTLTELSKQITKASNATGTTTVKALSGGTVKIIYAKAGDSVQDVMMEYGALAVLSLDDTMAVKLNVSTDLRTGDKVLVTLSDEKTVDGRVKLNQNGVLTVTVPDKKYQVGAPVTVTTQDGSVLGRGELYILNPWNATAYTGTVSGVPIKEETAVSKGRALFQLKDVGQSADYQQLIDRRHKYEELMQELFELYNAQAVLAPCDGIVTGVEKDGAFLLASSGGEASLRPLTYRETVARSGIALAAEGDNGESGQQKPSGPSITITTTALNAGVVGQSYISPLQASNGTDILTGTWSAGILPGGLSIDSATGTIYGTPTTAGTTAVTVCFTYEGTPYTKDFALVISEAAPEDPVYYGYGAQVKEIVDGAIKVMQGQSYDVVINDLSQLPTVTPDTEKMTVEKTYSHSSITAAAFKVGDIVLVVTDEAGGLVQISSLSGDGTQTPGTGDMPGGGMGGGMPGGMGGGKTGGNMPGGQQQEEDKLYSLEKLTVATVTSQEEMTLEVTMDEWDISKIYVGQEAVVTVDALAGSSIEAAVTKISNSGTNEGGNSKFTVTLTLRKSGQMLPGMRANAYIGLETVRGALCVPAAALSEENGQTVVYTSYDRESGTLGGAVPVTIGIADADYAQILDGLSQGTVIYYAYYENNQTHSGPPAGPEGGRL